MILDPELDIASREGYELIDRSQTERIDEKTIRYTFTQPYAAWRDLFSAQPILPAHALEGADLSTALNDSIPVASGPFVFESWNKGRELTVSRNENFWGEEANLDKIVFRFIADSTSAVQALRGDEVDLLFQQPQLELVEQVSEIDGVRHSVSAGPIWEHIDMNLAVAPLDERYVRAAIIQGIDRAAITEELVAAMFPEASVLQNVMYVNTQQEYEPHWDGWEYDPEAAVALLEENGCERGADEVFVCEGERLSFDYLTTSGNELRELQFAIVQSQLKDIGVELKPKFEEGPVFGKLLASGTDGAWGFANFAWAGTPDPQSGNSVWMCEAGQNFNSYCNERVDELLEAAATTIDPERRAALFNEADEIMARDVPIIPLYQKPTFLAWDADIVGVQDNTTLWGPTWNAEEWALTE
jgi:peptide/nickel transport system substrate-binding protein